MIYAGCYLFSVGAKPRGCDVRINGGHERFNILMFIIIK